MTKQQLDNLERLTRSMFACVKSLSGNTTHLEIPQTMVPSATSPKGSRLPIIDGDRLWRALFPSVIHVRRFPRLDLFQSARARGVVRNPWNRRYSGCWHATDQNHRDGETACVASVLGIAVYVLIMPQLSGFAELGSLLFILIFIVCYFLPGPAKAVGMFAVLNTIAVQNEQMYSFAAMANITGLHPARFHFCHSDVLSGPLTSARKGPPASGQSLFSLRRTIVFTTVKRGHWLFPRSSSAGVPPVTAMKSQPCRRKSVHGAGASTAASFPATPPNRWVTSSPGFKCSCIASMSS